MAQQHYNTNEPLFTVIFRHPEARSILTEWSTQNRKAQAKVEDNRMFIYDHNTLSLFMVTWNHDWDQINIWDNWAKRHINP